MWLIIENRTEKLNLVRAVRPGGANVFNWPGNKTPTIMVNIIIKTKEFHDEVLYCRYFFNLIPAVFLFQNVIYFPKSQQISELCFLCLLCLCFVF